METSRDQKQQQQQQPNKRERILPRNINPLLDACHWELARAVKLTSPRGVFAPAEKINRQVQEEFFAPADKIRCRSCRQPAAGDRVTGVAQLVERRTRDPKTQSRFEPRQEHKKKWVRVFPPESKTLCWFVVRVPNSPCVGYIYARIRISHHVHTLKIR